VQFTDQGFALKRSGLMPLGSGNVSEAGRGMFKSEQSG
jgi:hypothetical protein